MTSKLTQFFPSIVLQHRPLTRIALDNKIRAIISQFHPHERHLAFENTLNRIYTINPIGKECSKTKFPFPLSKSSIMMEDKIITGDISLIHKKVTEWLEHDGKKKKKQ